jgi:RNA polymerase sigma-70 factor, ECF subfamily
MADKEQVARELANLLARVALGDRACFAQLYASTRRDLFGVALRVLGSRETAEEALQEAFVNIWHNAATYRPAGSQAMTWMTTIVRNRALDFLRSEGKHPRRAAHVSLHDAEDEAVQIAATDPGPPELLAQALDALGIRRCMDGLDPAHRQALSLAYYQGLSHSEIGIQMGAPIGTVKSWVRRGLDRLQQCLAAAGLA